MASTVTIDLARFKKDLDAAHATLSEKKLAQATFRALNHTAAKTKTLAAKYIRGELRVSAATIKNQLQVRPAGVNKLYASLYSEGAPLKVADFPHSVRKKGVAVGIHKGRRKVIKRAFVARMRNGHVGVFARGQYRKGRGFVFDTSDDLDSAGRKGKGRITEILTTTVPQKLDDPALIDDIKIFVEDAFPIRLAYLLRRASGSSSKI